MSSIVWEDPPPKRTLGFQNRPRGRWEVVADDLRVHPGKWALVLAGCARTRANSCVQSLKRLGAETTTRYAVDRTVDVYARWPEDAS